MSPSDTDERITAQAVPWETFAETFKHGHKQGEHVAIVGPTGSGKSVLGLSFCKIIGSRVATDGRPTRVVVLVTKYRDDTVSALGWPVVKKWPPSYGQEHCIVWPRVSDPETKAARQRAVFRPLMRTIYHEGGQTVDIDEASYFEREPPNGLGLGAVMEEYWQEARSSKVTLIAGTQRPRHVTRSMWSEASWVCIFRVEDEDDLTRVAQLSGAKRQVLEIVPQLGRHEFVCVQRQRHNNVKRIYVSRVE